jgi:hypothetical protein
MQDLCCLTFMQDTAQYLTKTKKGHAIYLAYIIHSNHSLSKESVTETNKSIIFIPEQGSRTVGSLLVFTLKTSTAC